MTTGMLFLKHSPVLHAPTKHVGHDLFFVGEKVLNKMLQVHHAPGKKQWADLFNKPLSLFIFLYLIDKLTVFSLLQFYKHREVGRGMCDNVHEVVTNSVFCYF